MNVVLINAAGVVERECQDRHLTQKQVALTFALALHSEDHGEKVEWRRINAAIRNRWPRGLDRVKKMAWDLYCDAIVRERVSR